jgi:hypothetical protein
MYTSSVGQMDTLTGQTDTPMTEMETPKSIDG